MIPTTGADGGCRTGERLMAIAPEVRKRLAQFAKSSRTRVASFTRDMPSRWQPTQITDPRTSQPFTDVSAWEAIAAYLDGDGEVEEMELDIPRGKKGFVFFLPGANGVRIYVKLQNCGDHVRGRSFHIAER